MISQTEPIVYKLWNDGEKPYYKENDLQEYEEESWGFRCVFNITEPTLTVYGAQGGNSGKAVVILPGGGYGLVAMYHEGHDLAKVLASQGITAAVLKYRLPNPETSNRPEFVPQTDARKALKMLRGMADEIGFQKDKVGVIGFSAGSHLAAVISLLEGQDHESRPDFSAYIYGVSNLKEGNRTWLESSLYFREMTAEELAQNRLLDFVSEDAPPAFFVHAYDDDTCNVAESTLFAKKLFDHHMQVEMHLFPKGGHGFGLGKAEDGTDQWVQLFVNWLKLNN